MSLKLEELAESFFGFPEVYPQLENKTAGVLYELICLRMNSLEVFEFEIEEICTFWGVEKNSSLRDDFGIAYDHLGYLPVDVLEDVLDDSPFPLVPDFLRAIYSRGRDFFQDNCLRLEKEKQMKVIIITGLVLFGVFLAWQINNQIQSLKKQDKPLVDEDPTVPQLNRPIPTAICLTVPASDIYDLKLDQVIDSHRVIQLITSASDFLCVQVKKADKLNLDIDINQKPLTDSQLKFYIRIDIPDGVKIIDKKTKYVIKRDIPSNVQGYIKEIGRLRSMSGISSFNRV